MVRVRHRRGTLRPCPHSRGVAIRSTLIEPGVPRDTSAMIANLSLALVRLSSPAMRQTCWIIARNESVSATAYLHSIAATQSCPQFVRPKTDVAVDLNGRTGPSCCGHRLTHEELI